MATTSELTHQPADREPEVSYLIGYARPDNSKMRFCFMAPYLGKPGGGDGAAEAKPKRRSSGWKEREGGPSGGAKD